MRARFKTRLGALTLATALSLGQAASAGQKLSLPGGTTPTGSQQIPNQINYGYPEIEITGPVQGAFYDPSTDFGLTQITGKVRNIAPYNAVVTVNGVATSVGSGGAFFSFVDLDPNQLFQTISATVTDKVKGNTATTYVTVVNSASLPVTQRAPKAAAMRIETDAIDKIVASIGKTVSDQIPKEYLQDGLTVYPCVPEGCVQATVVPPVTFGGFNISVEPKSGGFPDSGYVRVHVGFSDLQVNIHAKAPHNAIATQDPECDIAFDGNGEIFGVINLAGDPAVPGRVEATLFEPSYDVTLSDYGISVYNCEGTQNEKFKAALEGAETVIAETIRSEVEKVSLSENILENGINDAFAGVDLAGPIGASMGVHFGADFTSIVPDDDGMRMEFACNMTNALPAPKTGPWISFDKQYVNSVPYPELGFCAWGVAEGQACRIDSQCGEGAKCMYVSRPSLNLYDLGLDLSPTLLSERLRTLAEQGAFHTRVKAVDLGNADNNGDGQPDGVVPVNLDLFKFLLYALLDPKLNLPLDYPLEITVTPTIAPIVTGNPGPHGSQFEVLFHGLRIAIVHPGAHVPPIFPILINENPLLLPVAPDFVSPINAFAAPRMDASSLELPGAGREVASLLGKQALSYEASNIADPTKGLADPDVTYLEIELDLRLGLNFNDDAVNNRILPQIVTPTMEDVAFRLTKNPLHEIETFLNNTALPSFVGALLPSFALALDPIGLPALEGMKLELVESSPWGLDDAQYGRHLVVFTKLGSPGIGSAGQ